MKILLQRVNRASVRVGDALIGEISRGLLLFVGLAEGDSVAVMERAIEKVTALRIFPNEEGKFHFSVTDIAGEILLVSQFTLFADVSKGRRPDFVGAMPPDRAKLLFSEFVSLFQKRYPHRVERGEFGASMQVALENDGPVTMMLEY